MARSIHRQSVDRSNGDLFGHRIADLVPARILRDSIYPKGSQYRAVRILFVDRRSGRRAAILEIFDDCDPEWRDYAGEGSVNGKSFDSWAKSTPIR